MVAFLTGLMLQLVFGYHLHGGVSYFLAYIFYVNICYKYYLVMEGNNEKRNLPLVLECTSPEVWPQAVQPGNRTKGKEKIRISK